MQSRNKRREKYEKTEKASNHRSAVTAAPGGNRNGRPGSRHGSDQADKLHPHPLKNLQQSPCNRRTRLGISIGKNAFKGSKKLGTVAIQTSRLTKSKVGANAFKGIKSDCLFKTPSLKTSVYKKLLKSKGAGKEIRVKNYY